MVDIMGKESVKSIGFVALIGLLLLLSGSPKAQNQCADGYDSAYAYGFTCLDIDGIGSNSFEIEVCTAHDMNCTRYLQNETLPLNITRDYVLRIVPSNITSIESLNEYLIDNVLYNLIILALLLLTFFVIMRSLL